MMWLAGEVPGTVVAAPHHGWVRFRIEPAQDEESWTVVVIDRETDVEVDRDGGHATYQGAVRTAEAYADLTASKWGPSRMVRAIDRAYGVPADKSARWA